MSSPIGHALSGILLSAYKESPRAGIASRLKSMSFYAFVANMPDIDFLPGFVIGAPNHYHHGISHSLGFGVMASIIFAWILRKRDNGNFATEAFFVFICFGSHLFFDLLSLDSRPPFGIPIFWPVSNEYYIVPVLPPIQHSELNHATVGEFFADALSFENLHVIGLEILLTAPFFLVLLIHKHPSLKWTATGNISGSGSE